MGKKKNQVRKQAQPHRLVPGDRSAATNPPAQPDAGPIRALETIPEDIEPLSPKESVFVSHASEDKPFVKQMVDMLIKSGIDAWYDEYEIQIGDSIRQKVNQGLQNAKHGVVVLSENFYAAHKTWTQSELDALWDRVEAGQLIPVLHGISVERLRQLDALFGGRLALVSDNDPIATASKLTAHILGPKETDEAGRHTFRGRTLRLADLAFREERNRRISATRFTHCVLLGPAILINVAKPDNSDGVYFSKIPPQRGFNDKFNVIGLKPYGTTFVGGIGVRDVVFEDCFFKDVGFIVSAAEKHGLIMNLKENPDLALWPVKLNPYH